MTDDLPTAEPDPAAPACAEFGRVVQRVLDREAGPDALDGPHPDGCPDCRGLVAAARLLLAPAPPLPLPPDGMTDRILFAAVADRRVHLRVKWVRRGALVALAASVLIAAYLAWPTESTKGPPEVTQAEKQPPPPPPPEPEPPGRMTDRVADAGSALAAITRKAKDRTVTPTRNLIPPPEVVPTPQAEVPGVEPAAESLAGVPQAAQSGIEPVARTTRRAVNLFLRDTGLAPAKPDL